MDTFFTILKKGLVGTIFVMFATAATYVPLPYQNNIHKAEALWSTVLSDVGINVPNYILQGLQYAEDIASNLYASYSAAVDELYEYKDFTGDGLAWVLAKKMLSTMLGQITDWIQGGFNGRPMFVQDIQGYMLEVSDQVFNQYMQDMNKNDFICAPFKIDIQIAISNQFFREINEEELTCTLTGVIDNIEGFLSGTQGSFSEGGGWDSWFEVTSAPGANTPYGSFLTVESSLGAKIVNAKKAETDLLTMGQSFLSTKDCKDVPAGDGLTKQVCDVVTPGAVIASQLNKNLGSENETLVAADEIDEVFVALLGQVSQKLFAGANSLLDM
jgi:hypothetical protein